MLYDIDMKRPQGLRSSVWSGFGGRDLLKGETTETPTLPTINVAENDEEFVLEVIGPGLCRENYELKTENNFLLLKSTPAHNDKRYTYKEYNPIEFERSFIMPENADPDKISAACSDGILSIHIPKKEKGVAGNRKPIHIN